MCKTPVRKLLMALLVALSTLTAQTSWAAVIHNFDITFDGVNATQDATSDAIIGTSLVPGDGFILDIHAEGASFWEVSADTFMSIYASFFVLDGGFRTSDVTTSFFLDGVLVDQDIDIGLGQSSVHLGAQEHTLLAGLQFDQVVVDLDFLSTTSTSTTIEAQPDILAFSPFFRTSSIIYNDVAQVPEPGTLALMGLGLLGMTRLRRKAK